MHGGNFRKIDENLICEKILEKLTDLVLENFEDLRKQELHILHINFNETLNKFFFNDNLTSVLLAGPAVLPVLPLAKFNFDILVLQNDPYCILLLQ